MEIVNFTPLPSLLGGLLIGLAVTVFFYSMGRICGISGIAKSMCRPNQKQDFLWRLFFIGGLILGGLIYILLQGKENTAAAQLSSVDFKLILAAVLVGFGTAYGRGCTSGHGICGIARKSARSIVATCIFMATGFLTVFIMGV